MGIKITVDIDDKTLREGLKQEGISNISSTDNNSLSSGSSDNNLEKRLDDMERTIGKIGDLVEKLSNVVEKSIVNESKIEEMIDKKLSDIQFKETVPIDIEKLKIDLKEDMTLIIEESIKKKEKDLENQFQNQMNLLNQASQTNHMGVVNMLNQMNQMNPMNQMNQMNPMMQNIQVPLQNTEMLESEKLEVEKIEEKRKAPEKETRKKISSMMDI